MAQNINYIFFYLFFFALGRNVFFYIPYQFLVSQGLAILAIHVGGFLPLESCHLKALQNRQAFFRQTIQIILVETTFLDPKSRIFQPYRAQNHHKSAKIFPSSAKIIRKYCQFRVITGKQNYFWLDLSKHKKSITENFAVFFKSIIKFVWVPTHKFKHNIFNLRGCPNHGMYKYILLNMHKNIINL